MKCEKCKKKKKGIFREIFGANFCLDCVNEYNQYLKKTNQKTI